jgi:hypothetical protein
MVAKLWEELLPFLKLVHKLHVQVAAVAAAAVDTVAAAAVATVVATAAVDVVVAHARAADLLGKMY